MKSKNKHYKGEIKQIHREKHKFLPLNVKTLEEKLANSNADDIN